MTDGHQVGTRCTQHAGIVRVTGHATLYISLVPSLNNSAQRTSPILYQSKHRPQLLTNTHIRLQDGSKATMLSSTSVSGHSRASRAGLASSSTQRCCSRAFTTRRVRLTPCAAAASSKQLPSEADVVVVGAGLAGLNAAAVLRKRGLAPVILEAGDGVGGRTRTDVVDGFLLDRGFQIFLTGYPEARETLDFEALQLQPFYAGGWCLAVQLAELLNI